MPARTDAGGRNQIAVVVASFIGFMGFTLVMPFLPLYFRELGVTDIGEIAIWSGLSLGVTPAMTALLAPFWGRLADRFGRKIMVERSLLSFVVVMSALGTVTAPWQVFALRALQGLFSGYGALTLTMAAESAPSGRMAARIGQIQTAQRLGPAVGPVIGGVVAQLVGLRRAFFVAAGFYVLAFFLVLFLYREAKPSIDLFDGRRAERVTFRQILTFKNFGLLMVALFGLQFVDRSFGPILPLYVTEIGTSIDRAPLISGILFALIAGAAAIGHHVCGRLLTRHTSRDVIKRSAALAAVAVAIGGLAPHVVWLFVAIPFFGLAVGVTITAAFAAAGSVIPAGSHGTGFGFLTSASLAGLALSPIVSGYLGGLSLRAVFLLDGVALVGVAWLVSRWMEE